MLLTLIQKEIMHHILSVQFVALLLMCLLLIPLTLSINYRNYRQDLVDYQEAVKLANIEEKTVNPKRPLEPEIEVSKLFLKPTPLSVFAKGLGDSLPSYLGMTRNGITQGPPSTFSAPLSQLLGHLDFLFVVGTVFSLLALLFTFDAVAGEREAGTTRITLSNSVPRDLFLWSKLIGKIVDHTSTRMWNPATDIVKITQPPPLEITTLEETFRQSVVDVLLLCFFAVVLTTAAFLKFFRLDI